MYIENISGPSDVKKLNIQEMQALAAEMRTALIKRASVHGGHCGPNFGFVEATIALHYVFNSPADKLVFDVSHQTYPHKMLTGRAEAYLNEEKYDSISGYSEPSESEHDHFIIGHTSTSVSLATGLAKGRDVLGKKENVIAIIGDGSLSGGEAFEGLNVAGELQSNFIIVVNDNQMSIAENHGGLYEGLRKLRETDGKAQDNFFRALNLDYIYVKDGNNIEQLIAAFQKVKDINHPIVVHINTLKGKGYKPAEANKENWHWHSPFNLETGESPAGGGEDYGTIIAEHLLEKMKTDKSLVCVAAGVPTSYGFTEARRKQAGKQFVDCGIAEEQAVAMVSGMAKAGAHAVFSTHSTFMQRTYDQLQQDLCVNNNPATILVSWGSVSSMTDVTHTCWYDIPLMANIPNMVYLAPTTCEEYLAMVDWSIEQNEHPVAIRIPMNVVHTDEPVAEGYSDLNKFRVDKKGNGVAIIGLGNEFFEAQKAAELLQSKGINATIINPRYITGLDLELLESLKKDHRLVVTMEDGLIDGGFGEKVARFYGTSDMKVIVRGATKEFADRYNPSEFRATMRMNAEQIVEDVINLL
ncbi:MAG: 1-deoxy-D-xylulose-5-phosphate synthase [Bacteroidales bacterium]|nr:1-deoxy-D-xylulose-5-phosphate synthase [Bacteroidales bacterium]